MSGFVKKEDGSFEAVVKVLGEPDHLGRVWEPEAMKDAIARFNARVEKGIAHGELGQPAMHVGENPQLFRERCQLTYMDNACCTITDARVEDNKVLAKIIPAGRWKGSLEQMLEDQVPLTLGIRALCQVTEDREMIVKDIVTFDVISPS